MRDYDLVSEAKRNLSYWSKCYTSLLWLHYFFGLMGIIIGAIIASGLEIPFVKYGTQVLGIMSTVIVGIVSFVQPGRMANAFYDAYWRLRVALLRDPASEDYKRHIISALETGYVTVATIQPEAVKEMAENPNSLDVSSLSEARQTQVRKLVEELDVQQRSETEEWHDDPVNHELQALDGVGEHDTQDVDEKVKDNVDRRQKTDNGQKGT